MWLHGESTDGKKFRAPRNWKRKLTDKLRYSAERGRERGHARTPGIYGLYSSHAVIVHGLHFLRAGLSYALWHLWDMQSRFSAEFFWRFLHVKPTKNAAMVIYAALTTMVDKSWARTSRACEKSFLQSFEKKNCRRNSYVWLLFSEK